MIDHAMTTTAFTFDGYRTDRTLGVVRGVTVRSRSVLGTIGASLQTLVGGNITLLTELCERTRQDAFALMIQHAAELGANAVVGVTGLAFLAPSSSTVRSKTGRGGSGCSTITAD